MSTVQKKPHLALAAAPADVVPEHIIRLRQAVVNLRDAKAVLARLQEATSFDGIDGRLSEARQRVAQAEDALQKATEYEADRLIADATRTKGPAKALTLTEARAALDDEQGSLDAMLRAQDELKRRLPGAEQTVWFCARALEDRAREAIAAELAPNLGKLLEAHAATVVRFWGGEQLMVWLKGNGVIPEQPDARIPRDLHADAPWEAALKHAMETGEVVLPPLPC